MSKLKLEPFGDRLIVEHILDAEATESGIILATETRDTQRRGKILAKGDACEWDLKVGDEILFNTHSFINVAHFMGADNYGEFEHIGVMNEEGVLCKVANGS